MKQMGIRCDAPTVGRQGGNSRRPHGGAATSEIGAESLHLDGEP